MNSMILTMIPLTNKRAIKLYSLLSNNPMFLVYVCDSVLYIPYTILHYRVIRKQWVVMFGGFIHIHFVVRQ
jgi:hypothetical protein